MNVIEKQVQLGRDLIELNAEWFRKIAEFDTDNVRKYVEFNQSFAARLPEVKDLAGLATLQREYGETLWGDAQEALRTRGEMLREAMEANTAVVQTAFQAEEAAPAPKAKRTTKAAA
ncbi:MAG: phasin family protein [Pseudomonadota bacterium]